MAGYLVLTGPFSDGVKFEKARFIKDGFSWLALIFGPLWLLVNRAWLAGTVTLILSVALTVLSAFEPFGFAAMAASLALNLFIALEGREWKARAMVKRDWQLQDVVVAASLDEAEELFFSSAEIRGDRALPPGGIVARPAASPAAT